MNSKKQRLPANNRSSSLPCSLLGGLGAAVAATVLAAILLRLRLLPTGLAGQWQWPWRDQPLPASLPPLVCLGVLVLAALVVLDRVRSGAQPSRRLCVLLLLLMVIAGAMAVTACGLWDPAFALTLPAATISDISMGYYGQALAMTSARRLFASHLQRAADPAVPARVRTHPPGPILCFAALRRLFLSSPGLLAWLDRHLQQMGVATAELYDNIRGLSKTPLAPLDALVALPLAVAVTLPGVLVSVFVFGICAVIADRRVGLLAALLCLAIPSLLVFVPSIDAVAALLAALLLYLWVLALRSGHLAVYTLCGLAGALALLWTYGLAVMVVPMLVMAVLLRRGQLAGGWRRCAQGIVCGILGFAAPYLVLYLWSGYNFPLAMRASLAAHRQVMVAWHRSYWGWLPGNLYDFLLFAGPAVSVLWVWALAVSRRPLQAPATVGWALAALLAVLLVSGTTRGEVGRIWLFMMPLMTPAVAEQLARLRHSALLAAGATLVVAQVGFALSLAAHLALVKPF